jgi:hypothetical protein
MNHSSAAVIESNHTKSRLLVRCNMFDTNGRVSQRNKVSYTNTAIMGITLLSNCSKTCFFRNIFSQNHKETTFKLSSLSPDQPIT